MLAFLLAPQALAQKRVALVVGNNAYTSEGRLDNAINDARLVARALAQAGFQTIEAKSDLSIGAFRQSLREFRRLADGAEVALIYYAGHGIEANGVNWLIPVDAVLREDRDLEYEAIRTDLALQALSGARMRIMVLDACRNNPFGRGWRTSVRSTNSGLAQMQTDDVLVLFAAAPGRVASDGAAGATNSPFAMALARRLPEPGLAVQLIGGSVRDDVLAATGGVQRPYVSASITGQPFYLVPAPAPAAAPIPLPQVPQASPPSGDGAAVERAWNMVTQSTDIRALEAFRRQYGSTNQFFDHLAAARIDELLKAEAERQRLEAARRADEERKKAEADTRRLADEAALARFRQQEAAAKSEEEARDALTRELQQELVRLGCNPGGIDGKWGEKGRTALRNFAQQARVSLQDYEPSLDALVLARKQQDKVCAISCDRGEILVQGNCVPDPKALPRKDEAKQSVKQVPRQRDAAERQAQPKSSGEGEKKPTLCFGRFGMVRCDDPSAMR